VTEIALADRVGAANREAHGRILAGEPILVDVKPAGEVIAELRDRLVLHAGPPVAWERMCGPMRGALCGAILFEGWADSLQSAARLASAGEIRLAPNHHFDAVGPMTGITTASMPVFVVENRTFGNRAFCTVNEGMGNVLRFGGNDGQVIERLLWMAAVAGPALGAALRQLDGIALKTIVARALSMGDEMHMRNVAGSGLMLRELAPALAEATGSRTDHARILRFIAGNDMFFLNIAMVMAKAMIQPAHGIGNCTVVTAMARNGTDFGIRLSGTGDEWFTAPAAAVKGLLFSGFSDADANLDIGDSCIVETVGLGGFAMAASPAVAGFIGAGGLSDAIDYTHQMGEITIGPNPEWTIPTIGMAGVPTAIDVRKVLRTGIVPVINTAIAHREAGRGQIGAGLVHAPAAAFEQALVRFAEHSGAL